jgi:hypothetical protein
MSHPDSGMSAGTGRPRLPRWSLGQLSDAGSWIPPSLLAVISGVSPDMSVWAALLAAAAWALVPAAAGLVAVHRRDVV